jgi:competence protein ComEC
VVKLSRVNGVSFGGKTLFYLENNELYPGEFVWLTGTGTSFSTATNPGGYDEKSYQYGSGIFLKLTEVDVEKCYGSRISVTYGLYRVKEKLISVYNLLFDEKNASLAAAMVLGEKSGVDADVKQLYQRNGIAHLIAISGLHIAMIGGTLYQLLRKLLGSYSVAAVTGTTFILLYGCMTGLSGATMRAVVMLVVMIGAEVSGRWYDILSAVALALFIMLIKNPCQMFQVGFLLSFGAVLGIAWISPVWKKVFPGLPACLDGLFVSISVQLMTLPVLLWFFYEIPVYAVFLNVVVVPLMSILLTFLIICGVAGCFSYGIGRITALPAKMIFKLYEILCHLFEKLPGHTLCTGRPKVWFVVLYYGVLALFLWYVLVGTDWVKRIRQTTCVYGMAVGILLVSLVLPGRFLICFFDVGQGDGIYLQTPNGVHILMDGGSSTKSKVGQYVLKNGVKYYGAGRLDYVFVSHSDSDHYSGVAELLEDETVEIGNLVLPAISNPDEAYIELETKAENRGISVYHMERGDKLEVGEVTFSCLNPEAKEYEDKNSGSLVFWVTYGQFDLLLTGDMDQEVEQELLDKGLLSDRQLDVLKVAHHGSATASSELFLGALTPDISVVSVAENNRYGHPASEVMERLETFCGNIYLTKESGAVTIETDGNNYEITPYLEE